MAAINRSGSETDDSDFSPSNQLITNSATTTLPVRDFTEDDTQKLIRNQNLTTPVDRCKAVYILFYLLGMATLLPWNFFITANGYWMYKLRDLNQTTSNSSSHYSPLQLGFTTYLCVTSLVPSTIVLILNAFFGHKFSFKLRIAGGLSGVILFFSFTTALVEIDTDNWQMAFYGITLASAFLINVISSVFQGGVCGLAGKFPVDYIHAVISGQALGGIFASVANVASIALAASPTRSAFIYFIAADVTLAVCLIMYLVLSKTVFFLHFSTSRGRTVQRTPSLKGSNSIDDADDEVLIVRHNICYKRIIGHVWPYLFSVILTYMVTLSLFPAVAVLVQSTNRGHGYVWNDVYFTPVACFLLMNVGDYVGRAVAGYLPLPKNTKTWTVVMAVARLGFVPLFMFCNALPRQNIPVYIPSDVGFIVIMTLFALSNGYLSSVCFAQAPRFVEHDEQEPASSLMAAALGIGLAVGGGLSGVLVHSL